MTARGRTLRLATRGSRLARRQAELVAERLEARHHEVELVEVETRGDQLRDEVIRRLGRTGAFVRALDEKVLAGELDAAVHSMKDMPTVMPEALVVAAVPPRAPAGDVLVTPDGTTLAGLAEGATVGTASLRRRALLLERRPDLTVEPVRGNVDTRLEKLLAPHRQRERDRLADADGANEDEDAAEWREGLSPIERRALDRSVDVEYDALVLAKAGLARADLLEQVPHVELPPASFVPAPGQGAMAVTALDDETGGLIHDAVDHPRTRVETTVERTVLAALGGGCVAPLGAYAVLQGDQVNCSVTVLARDGGESVTGQRDLPAERHAEAAREFGADLADRGAADLVEAARREEPTASPTRHEDGANGA